MYNRFITNHFVRELENSSENNSPEHSGDSPTWVMAKDPKIASKIRRASVGKKVISVPIKDIGRLRLKGDHVSAPPSDSWAWRKYGQKPIKGSPYPRCSSSKGCAARKQVERSRADPNMLIVTYSCEHNHPPPSSRNLHHRAPPSAAATSVSVSEEEEEDEEEEEEEEEEKPRDLILHNQSQELISENRFSNIGEGNLIHGGEFGWLSDFESTSSMILESPILMEERGSTEREMAMIFSMREEEEEESDLFADLGELPECSTVFRRGMAQREAEQRRRSLTTTG